MPAPRLLKRMARLRRTRWLGPEGREGSSDAPPAPRPGPAAKEYPFTLDPFQRCAINCLEAGEHCQAVCLRRGVTFSVKASSRLDVSQHLAAVLHGIQVLQTYSYRLVLALAGHSVLVAAHTSAGKTVIAQYSCAMGLRCGCKLAI